MNRRILVVDDTRSIHEDFRKILCPGGRPDSDLATARAALFGDAPAAPEAGNERRYELSSAFQGQEALERVEEANEKASPSPSPSSTSGCLRAGTASSIKELWKADPDPPLRDLHGLMWDYSFDETVAELGHTDRLRRS